jgi:hypothetical protein
MAATIEGVFKSDKLQERLKAFTTDDIENFAKLPSEKLVDSSTSLSNTNPLFYQPAIIEKGTSKVLQKAEKDSAVPTDFEVLNVLPVFQMLVEFAKEKDASLKGMVTADFLNRVFALPPSDKVITVEYTQKQALYKAYVEDMYTKLLPTFESSKGGGLKQRKKSTTRRRARAPPLPS